LKELTSALASVLKTRLNSPIIGSFILGWLGVNHKILFIYWFSEPVDKITMIQEKHFEWVTDLVLPAVFAIVYIFAIPCIQWLIDISKYNLIDRRRLNTKKKQDQEKFDLMAKVSSAEFKSQFSYQEKLHSHELEDWLEERKAKEIKIQGLTTNIQALIEKSGSLEIDLEEMSKSQEEFKTEILEAIRARHKHLLNDINSLIEENHTDNKLDSSFKSKFIEVINIHMQESESDIADFKSGKKGVEKLREFFKNKKAKVA
jgi:uncharacterized membrane protein (DUF106 family)